MSSDIDLTQLPIPDWGLECPKCRYLLRGLPSHRCPECGAALDMDELVRSWTRVKPPRFAGHERPLPDFGLRCRKCGHALAGASGDACPACNEAFDVFASAPRRSWFQVDPAAVRPLDMTTLGVLLEQAGIPFYPVSTQSPTDLILGTRVVGANLLVAAEFYFDFLALVADGKARLAANRLDITPEWVCSKCSEPNPGHFEVCWRCQAPRFRSEPER